MRIIVDTNQIDPLCKAVASHYALLKPYVFVLSVSTIVEIIKPPFNGQKIVQLQKLNWLFGKEHQYFGAIEISTIRSIKNFSPFYERNSSNAREAQKLLFNPTPNEFELSKAFFASLQNLIDSKSQKFFNVSDEAKKSRPTIGTYKELCEFSISSAILRLKDYPQLPKRIAALMNNHFTRHFMLSFVAHNISQFGQWDDEKLNRKFQSDTKNEKRKNDYIDLLLTCFARPGDIVLSNDKHAASIRSIVTEGQVKTVTCEKLLGMQSM